MDDNICPAGLADDCCGCWGRLFIAATAADPGPNGKFDEAP